jgi:hypothetical protein
MAKLTADEIGKKAHELRQLLDDKEDQRLVGQEARRLKKVAVLEKLKPFVCVNCSHLKSKHVAEKDGLFCPVPPIVSEGTGVVAATITRSVFQGGEEPTISSELWAIILNEPIPG